MNLEQIDKKIEDFFNKVTIDEMISHIESVGYSVIDTNVEDVRIGVEGVIILKEKNYFNCTTSYDISDGGIDPNSSDNNQAKAA